MLILSQSTLQMGQLSTFMTSANGKILSASCTTPTDHHLAVSAHSHFQLQFRFGCHQLKNALYSALNSTQKMSIFHARAAPTTAVDVWPTSPASNVLTIM